MGKPSIFIEPNYGIHNADLKVARARLLRGNTYKDCSTVVLTPTRGMIHARVVQAHMALMAPMNQKFTRIFMSGMEVGDAYSSAIEQILANPELSRWAYVLTLEDDNTPPPDGLLKLIESIEGGVDGNKYDAMGGLYWTKGPGGQAMIYGNPAEMPLNFRPQIPVSGTVMPCNGLGMGFTLFRLKSLRDPRIPRPIFKTQQRHEPGVGTQSYTQDLWAFSEMSKLGYRFACDCRVLVGHFDLVEEQIW